MPADTALMEKLVALCKRRGFIYPSSEIYGGINGFWDYGPLGSQLKRNIKDAWWRDMVTNPPLGPDGHEVEMVGVDCAIIMNPKVWEASGHLTGFSDPMVDCTESKKRYRADKAWVVGFYSREDHERKMARTKERSGVRTELQNRLDSVDPEDPESERLIDELEEEINRADLEQAAEFGPSLPTLLLAVEADGKGEAVSTAASLLTTRQRKQVDIRLRQVRNQLKIHPQWPRQSPATQRPTLTAPRTFNLMFKTFVGAMEDASAEAYLRPETAQGIFVNFKNVCDTTRVKLPFGIAQIGKSFRNEINPRNFTFRSREFEQMEMEFFCREEDALKWYEFWRRTRYDWYVNLGLKSHKLRLRDHAKDELAHYSTACADVEYLYPFSDEFQELEGIAHRGCFDLTQHQKFSGKDLTYFDDEKKERFLPTVIEPAAGADRATLAVLCEAYCEDTAPDDKGNPETRVLMKFHPRLAPTKAAIFPLVKKEGMPEIAEALYHDVKKHMTAFFDEKGSIGKRYRRQDEAGTPFCITIDGETIKSDGPDAGTVTIRDRDTLAQVRVHKSAVVDWLRERIQQ